MLLSLKKYFSIFLKYSAPVGLFIVMPLLVALYLGHNIITLEKNKHISELSTRVDNSLKDIESEITPGSFLLKVSRGAWYTFKQCNDEKDKFWDYYQNLCDYLQSEPDLYTFDENGNLVTPRNINLKSRFLGVKLWNTINSSFDEKLNASLKFKKQFKSFLGKEFKLGSFLENRNHLTPIIVNTKEGYIYWMNYPDNPQKGILLVFWDIPSFDFRFKQIIKRYASKFEDGFTKDLSNNLKQFVENKTEDDKADYNSIFLHSAIINPKEAYIDSRGYIWRAVNLEKDWLLASLKSDSLKYTMFHTCFITAIFILGIVAISFYIWAVKQQTYYLSIHTKLISLFLIAVITPVMAFSLLGYRYISDMRKNLINQFGKDSRNVLLNIDRELGTSGNVFRDDFRKLVKDFQHYDENENIRKSISESIARHELVEINRRLASDASVIKQITNYVVYEDMAQVTDAFSKCCIDTMLNKNLMDTIDPVLRSAMTGPECGLTSFWARPDNVQDYVFGSLELYLYWCFAQSEKYGKEYFFILKKTDIVLRDHLQKRLKKCLTNPKEKDFIIFVCNDNNEEWFPNISLANSVKDISRRINYMGKPIETEIDFNSKHYLLLGMKSEKIRGYSFYALYPYDKIEGKLKNIIGLITSGIILFIVMALAIGYKLSETFLYPVKRLKDGVIAIKARNTEFRIEPLQKDEFGSLATSFNNMIGDLKEIELAKYIQESLLPTSLPELNGYQLSFANRMASGVGGDYFDTMLLDDDNLCVIIGDVSGHGIASALVMAIAKSVLYQGFKETRNLIELFTDLNTVVTAYFFKPPVKKMITLFATIINLPTGKATFLDAGHNFPMKISKNGEITELKMVGAPVGALKRMKKKSVDEFVIEEGESVVFYTDGVIEATGKTSEQYGYNRFKESLSKLTSESSEVIINTLFENYDKWEDGTEPDDDVTLAVLKRLPSQNDESEIVS